VTSVAESLKAATQRLTTIAHGSARLEADLLLAHVLDKPRIHLITWPDTPLEAAQAAAFESLLQRRLDGEPMAYLLGHREFWTLDLKVTPDVLIPRPDTELLVEQALVALPADFPAIVADLGTGSGAVAAALAAERPGWRIYATDASEAALRIAAENFCDLGLQVTCLPGIWCQALPTDVGFHLIISNPPYIAETDPHLLRGDVRSEPRHALVSGADGLNDIRRIVDSAPAHLAADGLLLLEHGYDQGAALREILVQRGFQQVRTHRDLAGHERVSGGVWPGSETDIDS